ncbi:MAG: hypothetical protein M1812_007468 [Candelaria pacifica]|nr:MAG: hypothetical protein M1812_007468 [Candelaria pacifica]
MPRIHLGVYLTSGDETVDAVKWALDVVPHNLYIKVVLMNDRLGRIPRMYENESEVGSAINSWLLSKANTTSLKREDIHFTTKLATNSSYGAARAAIKQSLRASGMNYIDLFLLHSPYGGKGARLECWKAVQDAIGDGEIRTGGVSNFGVKHLKELLDTKPRIIPAVNQVEIHPFNTRTKIASFCEENDIVVEAYAPLVRARRMKHPTIVSLAKKYSCAPSQLLVRWSLQHNYVPLPKSVTKERIITNGDVSGFEIEESAMKEMDALDEYLVTGKSERKFCYIRHPAHRTCRLGSCRLRLRLSAEL